MVNGPQVGEGYWIINCSCCIHATLEERKSQKNPGAGWTRHITGKPSDGPAKYKEYYVCPGCQSHWNPGHHCGGGKE